MSSRSWPVRAAALLLGAAFVLHHLRFVLPGDAVAPPDLARQGHAYLGLLLPFVPAVLLLAGVQLVRSLLAARAGAGAEAPPPRTQVLWAAASTTLIGLYVVQESLEGLLAKGHPDGLAGVFGHGGWITAPLALLLGLLVALLMRGAAAVVAHVAARAPGQASSHRARGARPRPPRVARLALDPLARHLAGRGPPPAPV